jgi:hypothetical protein
VHHQGTGHIRKSRQTRLRVGLCALCWLAIAVTVSWGLPHSDGFSKAFVTSALAKDKKHSKSSSSQESSKESEDSDHSEHSESSGGGESSLFGDSSEHEDSGEHREDDSQEYSSSDSEHSDNGGDHEDGDGESRSGRKSELDYHGEHKGGRDDDSRPPRTVLEMLKRLTSPSRPRSGSLEHNSPGINSSPRGQNEILAVNLSPSGESRARKLGFKVGGSMHSGPLNGRVTRLSPPPGMNAGRARDLLQGGQPGEQFSVNQRYKLYHPARKDRTDADGSSVPARLAPPRCSGDRCFARQVIRWHSGVESCAKNLKIGIIDTQVDSQHPAFARANMQLGVFLPEGTRPADAWHGTGVLGLLAGSSDSGTPGLIPKADFYVASVFTQDNQGDMTTDTVSLLSALEWMRVFDVKIINMSFSGPKDDLVETAIERMHSEGVQFVAAVGNDGPSEAPSYPASYQPVIAVTAISKELRNYPYANRGERVDLAAPGVDIWSTVPGGREGYHTGTSFAAPYVTAMLATIYDQAKEYQKQDLLDQLTVIDLGPRGRDPIYGRGLMVAPASCNNFGRAVAQDQDKREPTPVSPSPQSPAPASLRTTPSSGPSAKTSSASFQ